MTFLKKHRYPGKALLALVCSILYMVSCVDTQEPRKIDTAQGAKIFYNEGVKSVNLGKKERAIALFDSSLSYDSMYVPSHMQKQDIFIDKGKEDSIKAVYDSLKVINPDNPVYVFLSGRLLDVEDEEPEYQKAVQLDSMFYWGYFGLGDNYVTRGMFTEAVEPLKKAIKINPVISDAQFCLGIVYTNLEEWKLARRQFEKTLLINPKVFPEAYFRLGLLYFDQADTNLVLENFGKYLELVSKGNYVKYALDQIAEIDSVRMRAELYAELKKQQEEEKKKKKKGGL